MESLTLKIITGYLMAGILALVLLVLKSSLFQKPRTMKPATVSVFLWRVLLQLLLMMLFWPLIIMIHLSEGYDDAKRFARTLYDHYWYSRTSDEEKVRRLLKIYKVFKRYRSRAREEKLLRATAEIYFETMKWGFVQIQSAKKIIELRIGTGIVSFKDLARAVLVLKKPCLGPLSEAGYDEDFRAAGEKDRIIELVLSESSSKVVRIFGNGKDCCRPGGKKRCLG